MAKQKKQKIRIYFKDGRVDKISQKFWDDYEYVDHLFMIEKKGDIVCVYNMDVVACIDIG